MKTPYTYRAEKFIKILFPYIKEELEKKKRSTVDMRFGSLILLLCHLTSSLNNQNVLPEELASEGLGYLYYGNAAQPQITYFLKIIRDKRPCP